MLSVKFRKNIKYVVATFLALGTALGLTYYLYFNSQHPSTDDAYIQAHIIQEAPQVSGIVDHIYVNNHQLVHEGQLLFTIDSKPFLIALEKAEANLQLAQSNVKAAENNQAAAAALIHQREAELSLAQIDLKRYQTLYKHEYVAKQVVDNNIRQVAVDKTQLQVAEQQYQQALNEVGGRGDLNAKIQVAKAAVANAKLNLQYTKVYAPTSGLLAQFKLRKGDVVTAYQSNFSLIDNNNWWVEANFKETEIGKLHIGEAVAVSIDMYPDISFRGRVESIAAGSGDSFSLMPTENASGNWVKVVQRFEVKIKLIHPPKQYPLRVGSSAIVRVNT
ncbi:MAG: HlyD family secretion protein [Gammaproteobacteria bacterium]|nr:HlyD family secretion protein [Gammaproteobacteria bacterium]MCH9743849.1 HlyD family secretion protein [Gammaproteobacteria bacterium]